MVRQRGQSIGGPVLMYHITGIDRNHRRFLIETTSYIHAMCINLWCGSVWRVTNGKRKLIKRVYN
jgi:hypothetical protein